MSDSWAQLERFLATDPRDVGCEAAVEALHVYSELFVAGEHPERRLPGIAAHLEACGPCGEDFAGLVAAIGGCGELKARAVTDVRRGLTTS